MTRLTGDVAVCAFFPGQNGLFGHMTQLAVLGIVPGELIKFVPVKKDQGDNAERQGNKDRMRGFNHVTDGDNYIFKFFFHFWPQKDNKAQESP